MSEPFDITYKSLCLIPSKSAAYEMFKFGLDLTDCKRILETGYSPRRRAEDVEEKWLDAGNKTHNIVIVRAYNYFFDEEVWIIKHVGRFTKKWKVKGKG